jgi:nitroreductase
MLPERLTMPIGQAILTQRSVRMFKSDPIPPDVLHLLFEAAVRAPKWRQPSDRTGPARHRPRADPRLREALPRSLVGEAARREAGVEDAGGHPAHREELPSGC